MIQPVIMFRDARTELKIDFPERGETRAVHLARGMSLGDSGEGIQKGDLDSRESQ